MLCVALKIVCRFTLFAHFVCWFSKLTFSQKNKNQEYMSPSECQKCWVKIRADRIKIRTDRSWSWSNCLQRLPADYKSIYALGSSVVVDLLLIVIPIVGFCNCSVLLSILVFQLCLVCLPGVSWLLCGSSSRCHGFVCSLWLWYFLIILT